MSLIGARRAFAVAGLVAAGVLLAACTPSADGGSTGSTSTTTLPPAGSTPTITGAEYAQSGVKLSFTPPAVTGGTEVINYLYDVSCDGGTTVHTASQYLGTTASPALANSSCGDGASSSYRLTPVFNNPTNPVPSPWRTADALTAPSLTDVQYATSGIALHFSPPTVAPDQSVDNYVYDVSCDAGHTTLVTRAFVGTTTSPSVAGNTCGTGSPSTYRIAAIIDSSWTSPYTAWRTVDALVAPTLTAAATQPVGAKLTFTAPTVSSDETVTDYVYDLSCDGGATVQTAGSYVGSKLSPATVGYRCASPATSTYRMAAIVNSSWTSPYSPWRVAS